MVQRERVMCVEKLPTRCFGEPPGVARERIAVAQREDVSGPGSQSHEHGTFSCFGPCFTVDIRVACSP